MIQAPRSKPSGMGTFFWALGATGFNSPANRVDMSMRSVCRDDSVGRSVALDTSAAKEKGKRLHF